MSDFWQSFVFEIGVEEIPSQYLSSLIAQLGDNMIREFKNHRISLQSLECGATPRRLVVYGRVAREQTAEIERVKGPSLRVAYRDGEPTAALIGFARRVGQSPETLGQEGEGDKAYVLAEVLKPVEPLEAVLPTVARQAFEMLNMPRTMRWGSSDERFIRPIRWCLLLVDKQVLPLTIAGIDSSALTYGNRADHPESLPAASVDQYWESLRTGRIMLSAEEREAAIRHEGQALAQEMGGTMAVDSDLMEEVTNLVEWPRPFLGTFDPDFLEVPEPVLITTMKVHQRYFPVISGDGSLLPAFIGVRNGQGGELETVRHGNEKVLRARLADARYFYRRDRKEPLDSLRPKLDMVIFHAKLGSYGDKIHHVRALWEATRAWWNLDDAGQEDMDRSIELYKTDLLTQVVQEFPELQGIMGGIYAEQQGEREAVVNAIRDQYRPGFQGDRIPLQPVAQILGLLDRMDTLLRAIDQGLRPTGSEDPFGLRRTALSVGRIAMESKVMGTAAPETLFRECGKVLHVADSVSQEAFLMVRSRLEGFLESGPYPVDHVRAVLEVSLPWNTAVQRLELVRRLQQDPMWNDFTNAFKRMSRVIGDARAESFSEYAHPIEKSIVKYVDLLESVAPDAIDAWWDGVLVMVPLINQLFEAVLIMDPDPLIRERRQSLLARAVQQFGRYFRVGHLS